MPKILMINTVYSGGGAAKVAQILHNALNKIPEFSSFFAYGRGEETEDEKTFKFGLDFETYLHAFFLRFLGIEGCGTYFLTKRLINYIKKNSFDLVHLHNIHGYYLNLSFIDWLKKSKIPVVWTLHDEWSITGRCAHPISCDRWKKGCGKCPDLSLYPKTYFFDFSALMWQRKKEVFSEGWNPIIICPSQWLAVRAKESYLNRFRIEVIPNGIDTKLFKPKDKIEARKKFNLPFSKKIILFVAPRLKDEQKGAKYFFEALKYIKTKDCLVLTMGKKINLNQKIREDIEIKQLGYISDPDLVSDIYNTADVFCITSLAETFPTTVLETMACGVPVIGFRVGGVLEQVLDDCGILVEPRDVKGLAKAIDGLLNNEEKRNKFSLNCRQRALENYSLEKFKNRYVDLYKKILK